MHKLKKENLDAFGAGDQGLMFGYATDAWDQGTLHPLTHQMANELCAEMARARRSGQIQWLGSDCKAQVTIMYEEKEGRLKPIEIQSVYIAA